MYTLPGNEPPAKPGALYGGAIAALVALAASGIEGFFWIRIYNTLTGFLPDDAATDADAQQVLGVYNGFLIAVVIVSLLISFAAAGGAAYALRGSNGGRIAVWIAGGIAIAWHLCCSGYTLLIRAVFAQAATEANSDGNSGNDFHIEDHFPIWLVDAAVIAGFAVGIASVVAVTLIALGPVNRWFRAVRGLPGGFRPPASPGRW